MLLLAIESSSPQGSLCLAEVRSGTFEILGQKQWTNQKSHSELLTFFISQLLDEQNKAPQDLEGIAVGLGPGSFTGVRVALNCARAISFSRNIPIYSVDSLRLLVAEWQQSRTQAPQFVLATANAFRRQLYTSLFELSPKLVTHWSTLALSPEELVTRLPFGPLTIIGSGWESYAKTLSPLLKNSPNFAPPLFPHAQSLVHLVASTDEIPSTLDWRSVIPLYIRGSEAEEKLREGALNALLKN